MPQDTRSFVASRSASTTQPGHQRGAWPCLSPLSIRLFCLPVVCALLHAAAVAAVWPRLAKSCVHLPVAAVADSPIEVVVPLFNLTQFAFNVSVLVGDWNTSGAMGSSIRL